MIITQTPLRISIAGGGTDLAAYYEHEEGYVVSTGIDKCVYVLVKERFDDKIYVGWSKKEIVDRVDQIEHELVREALRKTGIENGIEIVMFADIPSEGSGLGSSSSITVGLLNACYQYRGIQVTAEQLAREACEIEIDICKKPIGKQDQYIAAYGGLCAFKFCQDGAVEVERLHITENERMKLGSHLLLFFTNKTRSANPILKEQRKKSMDKKEFLGQIKTLAHRTHSAIQERRFNAIGRVLAENWDLKKELATGITNPAIDEMVNRALENGAMGGKISGAGGGGFLLCYCPAEMQNHLRSAMEPDYREMPFMLERDGSKVIFNHRRYAWK